MSSHHAVSFPSLVVARLPVHRADSSSDLVARRIAEEVAAVVAASAQSLQQPAQISASGASTQAKAAARLSRRRPAAAIARLGPSISTLAPMPIDRPACDPGTDVALRCLIVDDQPSFCEAARDLLEGQGLTVVGCATSSV